MLEETYRTILEGWENTVTEYAAGITADHIVQQQIIQPSDSTENINSGAMSQLQT